MEIKESKQENEGGIAPGLYGIRIADNGIELIPYKVGYPHNLLKQPVVPTCKSNFIEDLDNFNDQKLQARFGE